ncbi:MAG: hypothetical protein FWC61_02535 [Proteobacteria bacterium]|nr:hypothetical protein [Pseudomonadota bacterium]
MNLTAELFYELERRLRAMGMDSDAESFDTIKARLSNKEPLSPDDFARQAIYVILAGGFSQKAAKAIHRKIMNVLERPNVGAKNHPPKSAILSGPDNYSPLQSASQEQALFSELINLFNNKNKINAVVKIWLGRKKYRDDYYAPKDSDLETKLSYLSKLPHIGKITANHLARNLGEDVVKYDIWIQRLGVAFAAGGEELKSKIDNGNLDPDVRAACDKMFAHLARVTGLPRGYIDVVLWKACQNHMIGGI